jgi:hypothetical protein
MIVAAVIVIVATVTITVIVTVVAIRVIAAVNHSGRKNSRRARARTYVEVSR